MAAADINERIAIQGNQVGKNIPNNVVAKTPARNEKIVVLPGI